VDKEMSTFFGPDIPFWYQPPEARLSTALALERTESDQFTLPCRVGLWQRFAKSFKRKQQQIRNIELQEFANDNDDGFFDCTSAYPRKLSQVLNSDTEESSIEEKKI
jgi:hypothetical protein